MVGRDRWEEIHRRAGAADRFGRLLASWTSTARRCAGACGRVPAAGCLRQGACGRVPAAGCLRQGACGRVPAAGGVEAVPAGGAGGHAADRARGVSAAACGGGRLRGEGSVPGAPAAAVRRELRDGEAVRAALAGDAAVLARSAFHNYARRYGREEARKENDDVKVGGPPVTTRAVVSPCYRRPIRTVVSPPHATHRRKRRLTLVVDHDERADTSGCESSPDRRRDPGLRRANTRCSACLGLRKPVWHTQAGSNYQHVVNARGFRNGDGNPCDLLMVHDLNDVVSGRNAPE